MNFVCVCVRSWTTRVCDTHIVVCDTQTRIHFKALPLHSHSRLWHSHTLFFWFVFMWISCVCVCVLRTWTTRVCETRNTHTLLFGLLLLHVIICVQVTSVCELLTHATHTYPLLSRMKTSLLMRTFMQSWSTLALRRVLNSAGCLEHSVERSSTARPRCFLATTTRALNLRCVWNGAGGREGEED